MPDEPRFLVQDVSDIDAAFPANIDHLLPPWELVKSTPVDRKWYALFNALFFGKPTGWIIPKAGIDELKAGRHIMTIISSRAIKHEVKEAMIAFLLQEWFVDFGAPTA